MKELSGPGVDVEALWATFDGKCPDCGTSLERSAAFRTQGFASLDHIVPLSRGGSHSQDNVRFTCLPCNLKKGSKLLSEIN